MTSNVETVPGPQVTYANQVTFGVATSRRITVITPKYGGEFRAGQILRMEIPSQDYIDPEQLFMTFRSNLQVGALNSWVTGRAGANGTPTPLKADSGVPSLTEQRLYSSDVNCMKTVRFLPGIQCIFNRIKLLAGSTVIEDIQDYADLYRFMLEATTSPDWRATDGGEQEGFYDPSDIPSTLIASNHHSIIKTKNNYNLDTYEGQPHVYTIRPMLGLLSINKLIPVKYMGNLTIEFYMAENQECLWSSSTAAVTPSAWVDPSVAIPGPSVTNVGGPTVQCAPKAHTSAMLAEKSTATNQLAAANNQISQELGGVTTDFPNASYFISDVELHVPFVTVMEDYDKSLMTKIEATGLDLHFTTFHEHTRQITSTGRQTLTFTERSLSVKGGFLFWRNSDDIRDIRSDLALYGNNIEWYQWKIGNEFIPPQRVECAKGGARPLAYLKMALGTFSEFGESNNN